MTATATDMSSRSCEKCLDSAVGEGSPPPCTSWKTAGMISAIEAISSIPAWTPAALWSNFCVGYLRPPNSIEARRLALTDDDSGADLSLSACAARFARMGVAWTLVTGTHENTPEVVNSLYGENGLVRADNWPRLPGSFHGSGCTLASAIAALMAQGRDVEQAVQEAQEYTWQALAHGFRPGMGQHLPDRFFWARTLDDDVESGPVAKRPGRR